MIGVRCVFPELMAKYVGVPFKDPIGFSTGYGGWPIDQLANGNPVDVGRRRCRACVTTTACGGGANRLASAEGTPLRTCVSHCVCAHLLGFSDFCGGPPGRLRLGAGRLALGAFRGYSNNHNGGHPAGCMV